MAICRQGRNDCMQLPIPTSFFKCSTKINVLLTNNYGIYATVTHTKKDVGMGLRMFNV